MNAKSMRIIFHKKLWRSGINPAYVEPLPTTLIKETYNGKSEKYFVKLKLGRYSTSSTLDLYEFNMNLFDQGNPEEFLLFLRNFNMTLAEIGALEMDTKIQYLCRTVCGEVLHQVDLLSADVENT